MKQVLEEQLQGEEVIIGESIATTLDNKDQWKMSSIKSHSASSTAKRFDVWTNSYFLEVRDFDIDNKNDMALILKEGATSSYMEAPALTNKLV